MSNKPPSSHAPRIAIKFGSASSAPSKALNGTKQPKPPSSLGKRARPHALGGDDSGSEDEGAFGKAVPVIGFGADGAERNSQQHKERSSKSSSSAATAASTFVIGGHKNRDWRAEIRSRGGNNTATSEPKHHDGLVPPEEEIQWGLTVSKKQKSGEENGGEDAAADAISSEKIATEPPKDENQDAIDALMGKRRKGQDIVITSGSSQAQMPANEEDSYRRAVKGAAEISTIEEHDQIPDGEFGAAMLRGMGWKGEERAPLAKQAKRRPQFMGLGSKEDEVIKQAEAARKHGHRERRPRLDEYKSSKDKERRDRDDRHRDSYKSERERERYRDNYGHRSSDRDRDRDRDRHRHRHHDR